MDRCADFVDAGYLFPYDGLLCHNTRKRGELALDEVQLLSWLCREAQAHSKVEVLRTYWYDGARSGIPTESQKSIAARPGVKLRLGRVNGAGQQKGVDALIYRDLITLAAERAITYAYLLSGDEDLREGVKAAQDRGVRVTLIGIPAPSGFNQSEELCWEVDDQLTLYKSDLSGFLQLTPLDAELMRSAESSMQVGLRKDQDAKREVRRLAGKRSPRVALRTTRIEASRLPTSARGGRATTIRDQIVEGVRNRSVPLPGGVLVTEGGLVGGVAEVVHDLLGAGAGARCQGSSEVSEVVEVDLGDVDLGGGPSPRRPARRAARADRPSGP